MRKLCQWPRDYDLIDDALQRVILCVPQWRRRCDAENWAAIGQRRRESGDAVGESLLRQLNLNICMHRKKELVELTRCWPSQSTLRS